MAGRRHRLADTARTRRLRALLERDPGRYFWAAVVEVMQAEGWRPPVPSDDATQRLLDDLEQLPEQARLELSPVQRTILHCLANGDTRDEIAAALGIGPETVKTRQAQLYRRLGARNVAHAVAIGFRQGILL